MFTAELVEKAASQAQKALDRLRIHQLQATISILSSNSSGELKGQRRVSAYATKGCQCGCAGETGGLEERGKGLGADSKTEYETVPAASQKSTPHSDSSPAPGLSPSHAWPSAKKRAVASTAFHYTRRKRGPGNCFSSRSKAFR